MPDEHGPTAGSDIEARLARIEATMVALLGAFHDRLATEQQLGRELVNERAKNLELQRRLLPAENALVSAALREAEARAQKRDEKLEALLNELLRRVEASSLRMTAGRVLRRLGLRR